MKPRPQWVAQGAAIAILLALPLLVQSVYLRHLLILGMMFAILACSWDLTLGYAGIFNFAHVATFAVGAYASAIAVLVLGVSPWLGAVFGVAAAVLASLVAFVPAVRLRGVYVALTTFALGQLCQWIVLSQSGTTGGSQGMVGIPGLELAGYAFFEDGRLAYYYTAAILLILATLFLRWIVGSRLGHSLVAIRDSEPYAISRGISATRQHLLAFCASAVCAGIAGAFYSSYMGVVSPDLFGFSYTALLLSMVWFGGVGSVFGPILGALALTFVSEFLSPFGPVRYIVVSALIIVTLLFFPRGLWGFVVDIVQRPFRRRAQQEPVREPVSR